MKLRLSLVALLASMTYVFSQSVDSIRLSEPEISYLSEVSYDSLYEFESNGIGYHLNYKKIKEQNATTIDEVMRLIPSIHVQNYGGLGGLKSISVRGLGAQHSGMLLNGNLISDQKSGQLDLSIVPVQSITSINFNIGDFPSYSLPAKAYTYNNTLSIGEKLKHRLRGEKNSMVIGSGIGSFSSFNPFAQITHSIDGNKTIGIVYEGLMSQGDYQYLSLNDEVETRVNNDFGRHNLKLLYEELSDSSEINAQAFVLHKDQNLPGAEIIGNASNNQQLEESNIYLIGSKVWKNTNGEVFLRGNSNYQYTHYLDTNFHNAEGEKNSSYYQLNSSISAGGSKSLNDFVVFGATDLEYNYLESNNVASNVHRNSNYITGGVSYEKGRFKSKGFLTNSLIFDKGEELIMRNRLSGFLGVNYQLIRERLVAKFFYKSSFRMPSFSDLYYNNIGNTELLPEQSDQINMALSSVFKLDFLKVVAVNVNGFYGIVENKIVAVPTQNLFIWSMQNIGRVRNYGGELSFNLVSNSFARYLSLVADFAYTLQQNRDITNSEDSFFGDQIRYTPQEIVNGRITLKVKEYVSFFWNGQFIGHQFYLPENSYDNLIDEVFLQEIGFSYKLDVKKTSTIFQFSVKNVADKRYELVKSFPMQGRNYWGTITLII